MDPCIQFTFPSKAEWGESGQANLESRVGRNILNRKVPGFKSAGHALTVTAFVAINATIAFVNVDPSLLANYGYRFGW